MEQKNTFNPYDKILLKYKDDKSKWRCDLFSHIDEEKNSLETVGGSYSLKMFDYIPFAGNENIVGTSDMPEKEVELKEDELIFVFDDIVSFEDFIIALRRFAGICGDTILSENKFNWKYCIPFFHFNPNDMEKTRKHILCVKNGRLVRYNNEQ